MPKGLLLLVALITLLWAGRACADSTEIQLAPKKLEANGLAFQVLIKDVGRLKQVEVVVQARAGKELSPFRGAVLEVYEGKRLLVSCPIEKREDKGGPRYRFHVSPRDLDKVRFHFNEYAFAKQVGPNGRAKIVPMPAVDRYWFMLKDFAGAK